MNILFRIMTTIITNKIGEKKLGTWIYNIYQANKKVRQAIGKVKSLYNLYMNPMNWMRAVKNLNKTQFNDLLKELSKMEKETKETQTFKVDNNKVKEELNQMKDEFDGKGKWTTLSSSWLKSGKFILQQKNTKIGTLLIQTKKSTKVYAYPMVPYPVWFKMKQANGSNGGGAGTEFWKYWLHKWLPSKLREKVYNDYKAHNITREEAEGVFIDQTMRTGKYYKRSKEYKVNDELNEMIRSQGGKDFTKNWNKTYKQYLQNKYTYQTIETTTTKWRKYGHLGDEAAAMKQDLKNLRKTKRRVNNVAHSIKFVKRKASGKINKWAKGI